MAIAIYGIKNCDTMKRARSWLDANSIPYEFHDYKAAGIDTARLRTWVEKTGWETLLNRKGTSFRKLPESERNGLDAERAMSLMLSQPSMIKRPVIERGDELIIGFAPEVYEEKLGKGRT